VDLFFSLTQFFGETLYCVDQWRNLCVCVVCVCVCGVRKVVVDLFFSLTQFLTQFSGDPILCWINSVS